MGGDSSKTCGVDQDDWNIRNPVTSCSSYKAGACRKGEIGHGVMERQGEGNDVTVIDRFIIDKADWGGDGVEVTGIFFKHLKGDNVSLVCPVTGSLDVWCIFDGKKVLRADSDLITELVAQAYNSIKQKLLHAGA